MKGVYRSLEKVTLNALTIKLCLLLFFAGLSYVYAGKNSTAQQVLSEYIRLRSVSGSENAALDYFRKECELRGFFIKEFTSPEGVRNFSASLYPLPNVKPNWVFQHHADVVQVEDSAEWKAPPFSGLLLRDTIWGRGALDCKGLGVMHLFAASQWVEVAKHKDLPFNITLLVLGDEESGGKKGAGYLTKYHLLDIKPAVVFGEGGAGFKDALPADPNKLLMGISCAEKSNLWLNLNLKIRNMGHGAAPPTSHANKVMMRALNRVEDAYQDLDFNPTNKRMFRILGSLEGGVKGFVIRHIHWPIFRPLAKRFFRSEPLFDALVRNTVTLTQVNNPPGPPNQISEKASAWLDCRLLPGQSKEAFIRKLKWQILDSRIQLSILDEGPAANESNPDHKAFKMASVAVRTVYPDAEVLPIMFPASTDNNYFRERGIPSFGMVPIYFSRQDVASVHGTNEGISLQRLEEGIRVFSALITSALGGSSSSTR